MLSGKSTTAGRSGTLQLEKSETCRGVWTQRIAVVKLYKKRAQRLVAQWLPIRCDYIVYKQIMVAKDSYHFDKHG